MFSWSLKGTFCGSKSVLIEYVYTGVHSVFFFFHRPIFVNFTYNFLKKKIKKFFDSVKKCNLVIFF